MEVRNMRRVIFLCLALVLLLCCAGCCWGGDPAGTLPPFFTMAPSTGGTDATQATQTWPTQAVTLPTVQETRPKEPKPTDPPPPEPANTDFVRVTDWIPDVRQALAYATEENFTGQVIYDFTDAYLRYGTVKKLAKVCEELAQQGIGILIWDGFRPVAAQQKLWDVCPDPTYVSPPGTGTQAHCRGIAVDVTLVELETGELLPMPSGFDEFSALGDRDYSDCGEEAAENARLLEQTMEKYGFKPYSGEWWHFSDTDSYPIEEEFDPGAP